MLEIRPLTSTQSNFSLAGQHPDRRLQPHLQLHAHRHVRPVHPGHPVLAVHRAGGGRIAEDVLSLQQIAQSTAYRTNFGIVEGAGEPANVLVHIFNNAGVEVAPAIPISLLPGEHSSATCSPKTASRSPTAASKSKSSPPPARSPPTPRCSTTSPTIR